jgi:hypothetical protein
LAVATGLGGSGTKVFAKAATGLGGSGTKVFFFFSLGRDSPMFKNYS